MRRYSLIHPLVLSFHSREVYQDVARHWRGLGLSYLLMLLSLCTLPGVINMNSLFSDYINTEAPKIVRQIPPMTLSKGHLSVGAKVPYFIRDEESGKPLAIIDTGGTYKGLDGTPALILLTGTQLLVRQEGSVAKVFDLAEIGDLSIDRRVAFGFLDDMEDAFPFVLYPLALFFSTLYHFSEALVFGAAGYWIARKAGIQLSFSSAARLAAVSATPAIVVGTGLSLAGAGYGLGWFAGLLVYIAYLVFAFRALSGPVGDPGSVQEDRA